MNTKNSRNSAERNAINYGGLIPIIDIELMPITSFEISSFDMTLLTLLISSWILLILVYIF